MIMKSHPPEDAWQRLEWAKCKIGEFDRAIVEHFTRLPYATVIDRESQPGRTHRAQSIASLPGDWKRHVADFANYLRPPLDYAVVAAAERLEVKKLRKHTATHANPAFST